MFGLISITFLTLVSIFVWKLTRKVGTGANYLFASYLAFFVLQSPSMAFLVFLLFLNKKKDFSIRQKVMGNVKKIVKTVKNK